MIDPMGRWAHVHEKPDNAGLATLCGAPYTEDPAELAGFDVAAPVLPADPIASHRAIERSSEPSPTSWSPARCRSSSAAITRSSSRRSTRSRLSTGRSA